MHQPLGVSPGAHVLPQGSVNVYGRQMHGCILLSAALGLFAGLQALSAASLF